MTDGKKQFYERLRENLGLLKDKPKSFEFGDIGLLDASEQIKKRLYFDRIVEEANRELSYYRQRKEDLIARMATEWPNWGCGLDFYTFFISPFVRNSLLLHFINFSDEITLANIKLKCGFLRRKNCEIVYVKESLNYGDDTITPDLVDFAILPIKNYTGFKIDTIRENIQSHLVRIRDADIGIQAFFTLMEGIMRNSAKHGVKGVKDEDFEIRVIFSDNFDSLKKFLANEAIDSFRDNRCSYILVSVNRDRTIDAEGELRTVDGIEVAEFIKDKLDGSIIDKNTGELSPGYWGLKEIKICAAFIAGRSISEVNSEKQTFLFVGSTAKIWEDKKTRLFYLIKLKKPRYVLAVLANNNKLLKVKNNYGEHGVKMLSLDDFKNEFLTGNTDYDFLYLQKGVEGVVKKTENGYVKILPQRRVVSDELQSKSYEELIFDVYDQYISKRLSERNLTCLELVIYFDEDSIAESWCKYIADNKINCCKFHFPKKGKLQIKKSHSPRIYVVRHKRMKSTLSSSECRGESDKRNIYYFQHVSQSDSFFGFVNGINPSKNRFLPGLVLRQIVESSLLNVLIIDERIARTLTNMNASDEPAKPLSEKLYWMGIYVAKSLTMNEGDAKPMWAISNQIQDDKYTKRMIDVNLFKANLGMGEGSEKKINLLLIHATRLNEIYRHYQENYPTVANKEQFLDKLKSHTKIPPRIIIHSGRGNTKGDIPSNVPFLEYSIINKYVIQEPSKFYLIQIAMNAKGASNG